MRICMHAIISEKKEENALNKSHVSFSLYSLFYVCYFVGLSKSLCAVYNEHIIIIIQSSLFIIMMMIIIV